MKGISRILLLGGVAAAAFVALLAALFLLMPGAGEDTAQAQGGIGGFPTIFGVDVDVDDNDDGSSDNTATSLGTIDACIEVESTDTGPGVPGPIFDIDVFLDDVPIGQDLVGADWFMYYDNTYLQVNGWSGPTGLGCRDWFLGTQPGSQPCRELGETPPDTGGTLNVAIIDLALAAGAEQAGALGVLDRYEMQVVAPGPQVVAITFAGAPTYLGNSAAQRYDPDMVWDGNYSMAYGLIAIDTDCPLRFGIDMAPHNARGNGPLLPPTYSTQCACYDGETQPCACESGVHCLNDFDDDSDDVSNDGCGLSQIDACVRVDSGTFNIDVFVDDIPTGKDLAGFQYFLNYDNTLLRVNNRVPASGAPNWLLGAVPGSSVNQSGNNSWPHTTGSMGETAADVSLAAGGEPAGSLGPIERYELEVVGGGPTITALTLTSAPHYLTSNIPTLHEYDPDEVFDGNHAGPYGLVAIGQDCPQDSDGDGWVDPFDNCPDDFNPDQQDVDADGAGDQCDSDHQGSSAVSGADGSITLSDETGDITFDGATAEAYRTVTIEDDAAGVGTTTVTAEGNHGWVTKKFDIVSTSLLTGTVSVVIHFDPAVEEEKLNNMRVTKKVTGPSIEITHSLDGSECTGGWCTQATISFQLDDDATLTAIVPADTDSDSVYDQFDLNDDGDFDDPDELDNCALVPNPLQENHDDDAAGDACDCDDDNGGTPDNQEILRDDTDPFDPGDDLLLDTDDNDNDGALNWEEYWCGTDADDECGDDCNESPPPAGTLDAWAYDINIDCWANAQDILMFPANVNMPVQLGAPLNPTFQCRYDLDPDNWINAQDILMMPARVLPSMPLQCTNP